MDALSINVVELKWKEVRWEIWKKVLSLLVFLVVALSLTGCVNKETSTDKRLIMQYEINSKTYNIKLR